MLRHASRDTLRHANIKQNAILREIAIDSRRFVCVCALTFDRRGWSANDLFQCKDMLWIENLLAASEFVEHAEARRFQSILEAFQRHAQGFSSTRYVEGCVHAAAFLSYAIVMRPAKLTTMAICL